MQQNTKKKKVAVIGRGTAGAQSITHFIRWMPECEIEWHFDPNIPTQAVGEGSTVVFPNNLYENIGFTYEDLEKIDGTVKTGIYKEGWSSKKYTHTFAPGLVSLHFNAKALQNHIFEKVKDKVTVVEHNTSADKIDADFVMDCSGRPDNLKEFNIPEYIPVNSVHVTQCYWDLPRFTHTLTIARPYGWVFGIPLKNRCSIGYMYNKDINTLEEVKEDVVNIFTKYNLTPSEDTNSFTFGNYYRKENFTGRVAYNGNASFFLEPLEATSVGVMSDIQRGAFDVWNGIQSAEERNNFYTETLREIETVLMMHYFAGSQYDTKFWDFAEDRACSCMEQAFRNNKFRNMFFEATCGLELQHLRDNYDSFGLWPLHSFYENIRGLEIRDKLKKYL